MGGVGIRREKGRASKKLRQRKHACSTDRTRRGHQTSDPLESELKVVVSHLLWVLGIKLKSSVRAGRPLNC